MAEQRAYILPKGIGLGEGDSGSDVELLQRYLQRFGYLNLNTGERPFGAINGSAAVPIAQSGEFDEATATSLSTYQTFFGLPVTGVLDQATVERMAEPRCGVPDLMFFDLPSARWLKGRLTYAFAELSPDLTAAEIRTGTSAALNLWARVTSLTFAEVALNADPDFMIRFVAAEHGDGNPFDGVGNVLAHAFYPPPLGGGFAGDAHFDEAETWSVTLPVPNRRFDFVTVAAHEFGHSLGLSHSAVPAALMYPTYYGEHRSRDRDDVDRIRGLYPWGWDSVYLQGDPGSGIGTYDMHSEADRIITFDFDHSGLQDHLVTYRPGAGAIFIIKNSAGTFRPVYAQSQGGQGIGGYDLRAATDRIIAFDYESSGKLDYLVTYRPGFGAIFILKNTGGVFRPVYAQGHGGQGIGGYDLRSPDDQIIAFDYDHTGKLDDLVLYRPGSGAIFILKNEGQGRFTRVYTQSQDGQGIGGYDLRSQADQIIAFDYERSGRRDHLLLYRPGAGAIFILKNTNGTFTPVYAQAQGGQGIAGFDLRSGTDKIIAYAYDGSGRFDHLLIYRPQFGAVVLLRHDGANNFTRLYSQPQDGRGIGEFDLRSPRDLAIAYDYSRSGSSNHVLLYRPGRGTVFILRSDL